MGRIVKIEADGDISELINSLKRKRRNTVISILRKYGDLGVNALIEATPKDTGKTAQSWNYKIEEKNNVFTLRFTNSNIVDNWANIAVLLQYGHATRNGGWVEGRDYINPALRPIFDSIAEKAWEEVSKL